MKIRYKIVAEDTPDSDYVKYSELLNTEYYDREDIYPVLEGEIEKFLQENPRLRLNLFIRKIYVSDEPKCNYE